MTTVTKRFRAVDPNAPYPQNCHPRWIEAGETVSGRLAEIAVELGCTGEQEQAGGEAPPPQPPPAGDAPTGQTDAPAGTGGTSQARMLKKAPGKADDGSMVNYAKGTIVTGQLALDMISAGLAEPVA